MRLDILTILPKLLEGPFSDSILQRAQEKELCEIHVHDIRSFSTDKHRKVDDYSFGGSAGMVMTIQPILDCVKSLQKERNYDEVIYMTPDGEQLKQTKANHLSLKKEKTSLSMELLVNKTIKSVYCCKCVVLLLRFGTAIHKRKNLISVLK